MPAERNLQTNIVFDSQAMLLNILGANNSNIKILEQLFRAPVYVLGNQMKFQANDQKTIKNFEHFIHSLIKVAEKTSYIQGEHISALFVRLFGKNHEESVDFSLERSKENSLSSENLVKPANAKEKNRKNIINSYSLKKNKEKADDPLPMIEIPGIRLDSDKSRTTQTRTIVPRTEGQLKVLRSLQHYNITFLVGPAGTGKTLLPTAFALSQLVSKKIQHYVITRPVVEAGERLGYLPGDLYQKILPYMRPIFDELHGLSDISYIEALQEKGHIEIAPLAYMRGRTLKKSIVLLDEAQNSTPAQMKMFLTRLGEETKAVVTGDLTQSDLEKRNGLSEALRVFQNTKDVNIVQLDEKDVQRSNIAKIVIEAYSEYEQSKDRRKIES